jgi:hypothetical protein
MITSDTLTPDLKFSVYALFPPKYFFHANYRLRYSRHAHTCARNKEILMKMTLRLALATLFVTATPFVLAAPINPAPMPMPKAQMSAPINPAPMPMPKAQMSDPINPAPMPMPKAQMSDPINPAPMPMPK